MQVILRAKKYFSSSILFVDKQFKRDCLFKSFFVLFFSFCFVRFLSIVLFPSLNARMTPNAIFNAYVWVEYCFAPICASTWASAVKTHATHLHAPVWLKLVWWSYSKFCGQLCQDMYFLFATEKRHSKKQARKEQKTTRWKAVDSNDYFVWPSLL